MEFASAFKRMGSSAAAGLDPAGIFHSFLDIGFTGETYSDFDQPLNLGESDDILIVHFNDVYNIEQSQDGSGGIARFVSALRQYASRNPLILFSGDAFSPSTLSTQTRGRHMIPFLNMLKIHTACLGNHDFDFGIDQLEYLNGSTQFQWLLSNVFDADNPGTPLAHADHYRIFEWQSYKVGIMGLVEKDWLYTLPSVEMEDVVYVDFVEKANELSKMLREKECDLIIALTHMRSPNDERLAREAEDIDLILGGHDHEYYGARRIGKTIVVKSGTDFREFTTLTLHPGDRKSSTPSTTVIDADEQTLVVDDARTCGAYIMPRFRDGSCVDWHRVNVSKENFVANRHVERIVQRYIENIAKTLEHIIGETGVNLETRFSFIRTSECNLGNWLTDLMRISMKTDFAVLNSGTIRADKLIPPGPIRLADLFAILPMPDPLVVLSITGEQLRQAIENSVSQYPKREGRFLQVSGLKFKFDADKTPGNRLVGPIHVVCGSKSEDVQPNKNYTLCTKEYLAIYGKDGFDVFKDCKVLKDGEMCQTLQTMARNAFVMAQLANGFRKPHSAGTQRHVEDFKARGAEEMMIKKMPTTLNIPSELLRNVPKKVVEEASNVSERFLLHCHVEDRITILNPCAASPSSQ